MTRTRQLSLWEAAPEPEPARPEPTAPAPWTSSERRAAPDPESVVHRHRFVNLDTGRARSADDPLRVCDPFPAWARVACPSCGAEVGEACDGRAPTEHEPWASDPWASAHGDRHGVLSTLATCERALDPEYEGFEPGPGHWAYEWLRGNDAPLVSINSQRPRRVTKKTKTTGATLHGG